jgi:hypothetical protein
MPSRNRWMRSERWVRQREGGSVFVPERFLRQQAAHGCPCVCVSASLPFLRACSCACECACACACAGACACATDDERFPAALASGAPRPLCYIAPDSALLCPQIGEHHLQQLFGAMLLATKGPERQGERDDLLVTLGMVTASATPSCSRAHESTAQESRCVSYVAFSFLV